MAINMFSGERYTFAASNALPLLNDSSDGAGGMNKFHNKVTIGSGDQYNGNGQSILTIIGDSNAIQDGPQLHLKQVGSGNCGITFDQSSATNVNNVDWTIGIDSSESTDFGFSPQPSIYHNSTGYVMRLSEAGDLTLAGGLTLAGDLTLGDYKATMTGQGTSGNTEWALVETDGDNMTGIKYKRSAAEDPLSVDRGYASWDPNNGDPRFRFYHVNYSNESVPSGANWSSFYIYENGTAQANGVTVTSDARWKNDVTPLTGSLDIVKQLNPVSFTWNNISGRGGDEDIGFIAQEVEAHVPELVYTSNDKVKYKEDGVTPADGTPTMIDNPKTMEYGKLTAHLTKAIQEQQTIIEALTARIVSLENA
tara:strand:+ start:442 stop:1536 length:1095 start_codon:yes stop_codon:yes gene_type:complete